jgi:hypothetical protein
MLNRKGTAGALAGRLLLISAFVAPLAAAAVTAAPAPAAAANPGAAPAVDGLWRGVIVYQPHAVELDVTVEVSGSPLVGTIDLPAQELKFHPLRTAQLDGTHVALSYDLQLGKDDPDNRFWLRGTLSPDGKTITGEFSGRVHEADVKAPFTLERTADAGSERPPEVVPPLHALADDGAELRAAFNRDADKLRLVLLLSPTCPACLAKAFVTEHYVLDTIKDDRVRVYVVWGPMLGDEREENARHATGRLPDPRVTHFWTPDNAVAKLFAAPIQLPKGYLAWDTYQLFDPGVKWNAAVPAPTRFMQMNKPLPDDLLFDGEKLARWVRDDLAAQPHAPAGTGAAPHGGEAP